MTNQKSYSQKHGLNAMISRRISKIVSKQSIKKVALIPLSFITTVTAIAGVGLTLSSGANAQTLEEQRVVRKLSFDTKDDDAIYSKDKLHPKSLSERHGRKYGKTYGFFNGSGDRMTNRGLRSRFRHTSVL